jgi:hypothetical protein
MARRNFLVLARGARHARSRTAACLESASCATTVFTTDLSSVQQQHVELQPGRLGAESPAAEVVAE